MRDEKTGDVESLRDWLGRFPRAGRGLHGRVTSVALDALERGTCLAGRLPELADRSVLLATRDQLAAALALIELDGVANRIVLCPPDLSDEHWPAVIADAEVDAVVSDEATQHSMPARVSHIRCAHAIAPMRRALGARRRTEWLMFTSGTTGAPKMVVHSREGLTAAISPNPAPDGPVVWGTFYDIRRYGGLQIFFRALLDGASLVLSSAGEPVGDHLARLGRHGATHVSGTPSHWWRVLMSPAARAIAPRYVRLSGEIADQAILDGLAAAYPQARIGHAYASTEAGVGFAVNDGLAGFPASLIERSAGGVELKVEDGTLRVRSDRTARRYVGAATPALAGPDGFVDTGDLVELRGDRYHFVGRRNGVINVGGLKVHPEEVEAIINRHPSVRMSLVRSRRNPVTGALVVADVVLRDEAGEAASRAVEGEILRLCREGLSRHKVPVAIRFVPALAVAPTGKLARQHA